MLNIYTKFHEVFENHWFKAENNNDSKGAPKLGQSLRWKQNILNHHLFN